MRHTLKAAFDRQSDAQHVLNELLASGYPGAELTVSGASQAGQADAEHAAGFAPALKHTVDKLLGSLQHKDTMAAPEPSPGGRHLVTLVTDSDPDAERAVGIITRFGPAGIEDLHDEPDQDGGVVRPFGARIRAKVRPMYTPGTEPGALQRLPHEDSHYFGVQNASSPPAGNTFREDMGAMQWDYTEEESETGLPDELSAAGEDADAYAFHYGREMRASDSYRNRSWDEAEPGLRSAWDARAPEGPAWGECRVAVRRGWDSASPEIDDDSYYRSHWTTRYASSADSGDYDAYVPAYIYGSEARRSEKYRSREWRDAEPDLKAAWEARHPGQLSAWDKFKDAVRHGWNRITPDMDDDHLDAAYRHGAQAAGDNPDGDRHWHEVEGRLKDDWESRHAGTGASAWDKVKDAVRHGWERMKH